MTQSITILLFVSLALGACSEDAAEKAAPDAAPEALAPALTHSFPALSIPAEFEDPDQCQSWTLHNAAPLWVHQVVETNQGALHHSNWVFVPDDQYEGPDGNWPCADRKFEQVGASAKGGVFFAQSTQSLTDQQRFPDGAAFLVPAHSRIIGQVHTLNTTSKTIASKLRFDVFTLDEKDVTIRLRAMAFTNLALDLPPKQITRARMDCGAPQPDFHVYYVLPHYHVLGKTLTVSILGGKNDGQEIFRSDAAYGDPLGKVFDPPIDVVGAQKLRVTCEFDNSRDARVRYGVGKQEMCVVLMYADIDEQGGGAAPSNASSTDEGGVHITDAPCASFSVPDAQ